MARIIRAGSEEWIKLNTPTEDVEPVVDPTPEELIKQALAESHAIKENAAQEAASAKDHVLTQAYNEGFAKGYRESLTSLAEVIMALSSTQSALTKVKDAQLLQAKDELVELALTVAGMVLRRKIPEEHDLVVRVIDECLRVIKDRDSVVVQVNPGDIAAVRDAEASLRKEHDVKEPFEIVPCAEVQAGGARVISKFGGAEGEVEALFERIKKEVSNA